MISHGQHKGKGTEPWHMAQNCEAPLSTGCKRPAGTNALSGKPSCKAEAQPSGPLCPDVMCVFWKHQEGKHFLNVSH